MSDVVITMIGQVAEELEAVLGAGGVLEGAHPGLTLIDTSTVGIVASKKMAAAAREKGVAFLDATVSGSVGPARERKLSFMVGGDRAVLDAVQPVLLAMGERIYHVGPNGAGSAMKVIVNLMIGLTVLTVAETLTLGRQAGLDPHQMLEILGETAVSSPHLKNKGRMMIERQFEPAFALKYMQKDFDLIMEAAHELKTPLFTSAIAHQVYTAANVAGYGELDYAGVIRFLENVAALQNPDDKDTE
jgi:3-hydroxyisobutyrate dehydrogenase-like beta-hydroxyacid dehydrogenase